MSSRVAGSRALGVYPRLLIAAMVTAERMTRARRHRGYWHVGRVLGVGAGDARAVVTVGPGSLEIQLADPYWTRLVADGYVYEPEVDWLLSSILDDRSDFVDVGANIGYWSVWVSQRFVESRVIAVEPNPVIFSELRRNKERNGDRFEALQLAVAVTERRAIPFRIPAGRGGHAGAHLVAEAALGDTGEVLLVDARPLDEILERVREPGRRVLVKLDIEGMETSVLESCQACCDPDVAVLYEDHGFDPSCRPTALLLDQVDRAVFFVGPERGVVEVFSTAQLAVYKENPKVGYNCVTAVRGSAWHAALSHLAVPG